MSVQAPRPLSARRADERSVLRFGDAGWANYWQERGWTAPDRAAWPDPLQDRRFLLYAASLRDKFGFVRFVGLPTQGGPEDTAIEKLYVEPALSAERIDPGRVLKDWPETTPLIDAVIENPRMVVLGDPGSGKSSLVSWLVLSLLSREKNRLKDAVGPLIPLTLVLRDLPIDGEPTWEKLLTRFIAHPSGQALGSSDQIEPYLKRGQVMVLVDGLDEAGSTATRKAIVAALHAGFERYPSVRWVITSRVVGYDDAPVEAPRAEREFIASQFESFKYKSIDLHEQRTDQPLERAAHRFVVPFDDERIGMFIRNWHEQHEPDRAERSTRSAKLLAAIDRSPHVKGLARIPNLLTMIALVYRVYLRLPDGRALLYERIAQAYLETIETARKLPTLGHTLEDMKRWLGYAAFQMQRARFGTAPSAQEDHGILVSRRQLVDWIVFAMAKGNEAASESQRPTAVAFVEWVARRAGLIIPRSEELFAFTHLSFQEYFAAWFIAEQVTSPAWIKNRQGYSPIAEGTNLAALQTACGDPRWHETLVLLFELLGVRGEWSDEILDQLFSPADDAAWSAPVAALRRGEDEDTRYSLLVELARDQHSGLAQSMRNQCFLRAWQAVAARSDRMFKDGGFFHPNWLVDKLLTPERGNSAPAWAALLAAPMEMPSFAWMNADDSALRYLSQPSHATASMRSVYLAGGITDAGVGCLSSADTALAGLTRLDLHGDELTDSTIMAIAHRGTGLRALVRLDVSGCRVTDAGAAHLADDENGLKELRELCLSYTQISDAGLRALARPASRLRALEVLALRGTQITDLGLKQLANPEGALTNLQFLDIYNPSVTDAGLTELSRADTGLASLMTLIVGGPLLSDQGIRALSRSDTGLKALVKVRLGGGRVTDEGLRDLLRADSGLNGLKALDISNTAVTDTWLRELASSRGSLQRLEMLNVKRTAVSADGIAALQESRPALVVSSDLPVR